MAELVLNSTRRQRVLGWLFASDPTHVTFIDDARLADLCTSAGLLVRARRSFPLPRRAGRWFIYNEFIVDAKVPAGPPR